MQVQRSATVHTNQHGVGYEVVVRVRGIEVKTEPMQASAEAVFSISDFNKPLVYLSDGQPDRHSTTKLVA